MSLYSITISCRVERFQLVESFVDCEDLNKFGRFSFNNFNKKIEVSLSTLLPSNALCKVLRTVHYCLFTHACVKRQ